MALKTEFIDFVIEEWRNGLNPPAIARKNQLKLHKVYYALKKVGVYPKRS